MMCGLGLGIGGSENDGTSHFAGRSVTGGRSMFIELGRAMKSIWIMGKGWERNCFL